MHITSYWRKFELRINAGKAEPSLVSHCFCLQIHLSLCFVKTNNTNIIHYTEWNLIVNGHRMLLTVFTRVVGSVNWHVTFPCIRAFGTWSVRKKYCPLVNVVALLCSSVPFSARKIILCHCYKFTRCIMDTLAKTSQLVSVFLRMIYHEINQMPRNEILNLEIVRDSFV